MSIKKELHSIEHTYQIELWQTYKLTEETYEQLAGKLQKPNLEAEMAKLDNDERKNIELEVEKFLNTKHVEIQATSPISQKYVGAIFNDFVVEKRINNLVEMAFIYMITLMEAFNKEYFTLLFCKKPVLLKSSKSITYDEILSFDDITDIYSLLAEKEVEQISYKNIDQLAEYFKQKFKMDFDESQSWWEICREASYRRNLVVHNKGIVNTIYTAKVNNAPVIGTKLNVSIDYLLKVTEAIKEYIAHVDKVIPERLNIQ